jgi:hypothetical protein
MHVLTALSHFLYFLHLIRGKGNQSSIPDECYIPGRRVATRTLVGTRYLRSVFWRVGSLVVADPKEYRNVRP